MIFYVISNVSRETLSALEDYMQLVSDGIKTLICYLEIPLMNY